MSRRRSGQLVIASGLAVTIAALVGCAPPRSDAGLDADAPPPRIAAIHHAGQSRDAAAVPKLIEQLASDDPAIRLYAIAALQKITGRRHGYQPHARAEQRAAAVDRWAAWYRAQRTDSTDTDTATQSDTQGT